MSYASPSLALAPGAYRTGREDAHEARAVLGWERRVVGSDAPGLSLYAGVGTDLRLLVRTHHYDARGSELYADFFAPLEARGTWEYVTAGRGVVSGRLAVAVASLALRDPWAGAKYMPGVEVHGGVGAPMLRHVLSYRFGLGGSVDAVVSHELAYLRYPPPRRLTLAGQDLGLTVEWRP